MKRLFCIFLALLLLLVGCQKQTGERDYDIYYPVKDTSLGQGDDYIQPQTYHPEEGFSDKSIEEKANVLLEKLLLESPPEGYQRPLYGNNAIVSVTLNGNVLTVVLSGSYHQLTGYRKNMADVCILKTVTQLQKIRFVRIQAEEAEESVLISNDMVLLSKDGTVREVTGEFYYANGAEELESETRTVQVNADSNVVEAVLNELMLPPDNPDLSIMIDSNFGIVQIEENGTSCTLSLNRDGYYFVKRNSLACLSIELTLRSLGYDTINFTYNGETVDYRYY